MALSDTDVTAASSVAHAANGSGRLTTAEVYEALRRKILDHTIPPATKVNIHHLSREFGVSPTPVREALRLLQGDNLLVATSNKGYATTEVLDLQGVRDLFEFRLLIEPWAARTAATNRLNNPAHVLDGELAHFDAAGDSLRHALIAHDSRFHRAILESTENQTVIQSFEQSHCHLHLFRMYGHSWDWRTTIKEHESIAEAIRAADPAKAEDMMRRHLQSAYMRFFNAMANQQEDPAELRASVSPNLIIG
jgi:DNA-binding GntR family transcriptional regulator